MNVQSPVTAADRDIAAYAKVVKPSHQDLLAFAAKKSGRSVLQIQRDFQKMAKSHSRINIAEFVRHGLYDPDRYSEEERALFISNDTHWPIAHACCDANWNAAAEDKVLASTILSAGGVPVPESVAVIDKSTRVFPGLTKISTADDLRAFMAGYPDGGIFGKIVTGMVSFGAFRVVGADDTHITCAGNEPYYYEEFMAGSVGDNAYLLQKELQNAGEFSQYASALCTVRMVNLLKDDGVFCPMAVIKMPQGDNIADAYWRKGNLACEIDVDTGKILTVSRRNGFEIEYLDDHPETAGLMGLQLPHWERLREVNARAAQIFAPLRYQSTDIAITDNGPVVVELNYGGGFDLPQNASSRGMLTPEVRAFFEGFGHDFDAKPKKRLGIFGR
ncbi:MAG: sugar-transfer associated ATP-grasp domain-containing protein [Pseudomonadota bacterium]